MSETVWLVFKPTKAIGVFRTKEQAEAKKREIQAFRKAHHIVDGELTIEEFEVEP